MSIKSNLGAYLTNMSVRKLAMNWHIKMRQVLQNLSNLHNPEVIIIDYKLMETVNIQKLHTSIGHTLQ